MGTLRRLAWTDHDSHLVTVGGLDRNICIWRFVPDSADSIYNYTIGANQTAQDYDDAAQMLMVDVLWPLPLSVHLKQLSTISTLKGSRRELETINNTTSPLGCRC